MYKFTDLATPRGMLCKAQIAPCNARKVLSW